MIPKCGEVDIVCADCGEEIETVDYGKYTTIKSGCEKCGSSVYEAKISEDHDTVYWSIYCSKCKNEPEIYYIDKEGNEIDVYSRKLLLMEDEIEELTSKIDLLEEDIKELDNEFNKLNI